MTARKTKSLPIIIEKYENRLIELNKINELSKTASGVRLYRNGFRVLPYGEVTDDWTQIDRRWSSESGTVNVPLSNKNLFGFVEISDPNGSVFEETASREGLIENDAFRQLTDFVHKSLLVAKSRIAEKITQFKDVEDEDNFTQKSIKEEQSEQELLESITKMIQGDNTQDNDPHSNSSTIEKALIIKRINRLIEETGMLRVLAGLGLSIGEFTHEIKPLLHNLVIFIYILPVVATCCVLRSLHRCSPYITPPYSCILFCVCCSFVFNSCFHTSNSFCIMSRYINKLPMKPSRSEI